MGLESRVVESQRVPKKRAAVAAGLPLHQRIREDIEGRIMQKGYSPFTDRPVVPVPDSGVNLGSPGHQLLHAFPWPL